MTLEQAEYLAGYAAGTGAVPLRPYDTMHEPHYARGLEAGRCAAWCGVDLSTERPRGVLLFSLNLSRHIKGFGKPAVAAEPRAIVGHYVDGKPYAPDGDDVRRCLPHYYRKAFDRSRGVWWFDKYDNAKPAHLTLCDTRGRYLNTVYALPYMFTVDTSTKG